MSRLFITNDASTFRRVLEGWQAAELPEGARLIAPEASAAVAKKRSIDHENALVLEEDRWAVGTGTYVTYSGTLGAQALTEIMRVADPRDPTKVRDLLFGHYAIAFRTGNRIFVFCDAIASYELYFWTDPAGSGAFAVTNFLSDLLAHPAIVPTVTDLDALRAAYHGERGIGRTSLFDGVLSMRGHEFVEIIITQGKSRAALRSTRIRPQPAPVARDFDSLLQAYIAESDRIFAALPVFSNIAINCTGGLDSRLLVAAARRHDLAPLLLYGVGNSRMTNTRREDLEAARAIGEAYGWPLHVMDWRQDKPYTRQDRRRLHARYGFKQPYGSTEGLIRSFEGGIQPYPQVQMGGYNPAFTNRKPWSWANETIALEEFVRRFAADYIDIFASEAARQTYLDHLALDFVKLAADIGVDIENGRLAREDFVRLLIQGRSSKGAFNLNVFNQFAYYLAPYFTTSLFSCLTAVPAAWRNGDHFQLHAIKANCHRALDFPIFSGVRQFRLDRETMTISAVDAPGKLGVVRRAGLRARDFFAGRASSDLRTRFGLSSQAADVTPYFRQSLRKVITEAYPSRNIDCAAFAQKDLRAVYRYVTARELPIDCTS
jgi:hypothetical protein